MNAREELIEATLSAYRERDATGAIRSSPEWCDLSADDREAAFERQLAARRLEAALDPDGASTTARSVLSRTRMMLQLR